jgi:Protein of unknown function (DUF2730)
MTDLVYYSPFLTALISLCSLGVSMAALYSIRQRATRTEMLAMERRLATLETARETAPGWGAFNTLQTELREVHGHVENLSGELKAVAHNTELILQHLLSDRRESMP